MSKVIELRKQTFFKEEARFNELVILLKSLTTRDLDGLEYVLAELDELKTFERITRKRDLEMGKTPLVGSLKDWIQNFLDYPALPFWLGKKTGLKKILDICEFLETEAGTPLKEELLNLTQKDYEEIEQTILRRQ